MERYMCTLPNGRTVDLNTPHGADAFLTQPDFSPFSKNLKDVKKMAKKKINGDLKRQLKWKMNMFGALFSNASKSTVEQAPYEELVAWISFMQWLLELRTKYTREGTWRDEDFDRRMFDNLSFTFGHYPFVEIIYEKKLLQTMAEFMSTQPRLPSDGIAETFCAAFSSFLSCLQHNEDGWCVEKIQKLFTKMESCGVLIHFLKCCTCPPARATNMVNMSRVKILECLKQCTDLLRKRFIRGTPCGDMLEGIVKGTEGHPRNKHPQIQATLRNIYGIAASISDAVGTKKGATIVSCRFCSKIGHDLKSCSRCKTAFYCSQECQTKDWKVHKKSCTPMDKSAKSMKKMNKTGTALVQSFLRKNACDVVSAVSAKMEETGLELKDLVLELNFLVEDGALPPSLRDPPFFKIGVTKRYYEGDRPETPSVITTHCQENIDAWLARIKEMHAETTNEQLLLCVMCPRHPLILTMTYASIQMMAFVATQDFDGPDDFLKFMTQANQGDQSLQDITALLENQLGIE